MAIAGLMKGVESNFFIHPKHPRPSIEPVHLTGAAQLHARPYQPSGAGFFVSIFAYCLIVLRTIRGDNEGRFIPSLAVSMGLVLVSIGI